MKLWQAAAVCILLFGVVIRLPAVAQQIEQVMGDANHDGTVSLTDFEVWRTAYIADVALTPIPSAVPTNAVQPTIMPAGIATEENTGPTGSHPQSVGEIVVEAGQSKNLSNVIVDSIIVRAGGELFADHIKVTGSVVLLPQMGVAPATLRMKSSSVYAGITINAVDAAGNLDWNNDVPVDVVVEDSWIRHPQGSGTDHTEALAGFGWPKGAQFIRATFIQLGPFNATATTTINWHGVNTVFDGCYFGWGDQGVAAYYTVYVEGSNNIVKNSRMEKGQADYIYPDSDPKATYQNNVDAVSDAAITP